MEALGILKFWRNAGPIADVSSDDGDSFFDLVLKSPDRGEIKGGDEVLNKDHPQSPRDVLLSKSEFSNSKPLSPVTILRSAPKFKVFMLGLKKPSKSEPIADSKASPLNQLSKSSCKHEQSNRFAETPIASSFARDNSLRSKLLLKESFDCCDVAVVSSEKSVPKYMRLIKPFYTKSSKKAKCTESNTPSCSPVTAPVNFSPRKLSDGGRIGSFKIASRNLGKSKSASVTVGMPPQAPLRRRDDSLLEQNDGIQGAILHCKKSFNCSSKEYSQLFRSASDASYPVRKSCEEQKRCSI